MGVEETITNEAALAIDDAVRKQTVGIVCGSGEQKWRGLGTGSLVRWFGTPLILTACHVLDNTVESDLRFFLPAPSPPRRMAGREEIRRLEGGGTLLRFSHLNIHKIARDQRLDLAAIAIDEALDGEHETAQFFDLEAARVAPAVGQTVITTGFPQDLTRTLNRSDKARATFMYTQWTAIRAESPTAKPKRDFDPQIHFLTDFAEEEDSANPLGMSGGGMWFRRGPTPAIWHPNLDLAGVTINYYKASRVLSAVRREVAEAFLQSAFP